MIQGCEHHKLALLLLILLHWASDAEGIKCFQCSSLKDPECTELSALYGGTPGTILSAFTAGLNATGALPSDQKTKWGNDLDLVQRALRHYKDCEDSFGGKREPFCRKMHQTIFARDNLQVVTRSCGWEKHLSRECYNFENKGHAEIVCQCFEDGCNGAAGTALGAAAALAASVVLRLL